MFDKDELVYLLGAVNTRPIASTADARNKAHMLVQVSDALESLEEDSEVWEISLEGDDDEPDTTSDD